MQSNHPSETAARSYLLRGIIAAVSHPGDVSIYCFALRTEGTLATKEVEIDREN